MSDFDFSTLITDRTSADVSALSALMGKRLETWTEEELEQFNNGMLKGGYWWNDLNRVTACMEYMDEELRKLGCESGYIPVVVHQGEGPVYDENTLLLIHGEDFLDHSKYKVPLVNNGAQVSGEQSKFGPKSIYFDGNSTLEVNTLFNIGAGDLTIDWWEYLPGIMTNYGNVFGITGESGTGGILLAYSGGYITIWDSPWNGLSIGPQISGAWTHRALVRYNGVLKFYSNGSETWRYDYASDFPNYKMIIGGRRNMPSQNWTGYIDELRVSNVARWITDFTPQTGPYVVESYIEPQDKYTWRKDDVPTANQLEKYLANVSSIMSAIAELPQNPSVPEAMRFINYIKANNIEKILKNVNAMVENMKKSINIGWALGISDIGIYGGV